MNTTKRTVKTMSMNRVKVVKVQSLFTLKAVVILSVSNVYFFSPKLIHPPPQQEVIMSIAWPPVPPRTDTGSYDPKGQGHCCESTDYISQHAGNVLIWIKNGNFNAHTYTHSSMLRAGSVRQVTLLVLLLCHGLLSTVRAGSY